LDWHISMANSKSKRVTLKDVAEAAGVSMQTVSRVANDKPGVAAKTLKRVTRVMEELGYQPNTVARMLQTQRSFTLEVVAVDVPLLPSPLVEMGANARHNGYHMVFTSGTENEFDAMVESMKSRLVDGFILIAPRMQNVPAKLHKLDIDIPFVSMLMGEVGNGSEFASVVFDQEYGMKLLIEHLLSYGHQHIAEISGPLTHDGGRSRHETWLKLAHEYDIVPGPSVSVDFSMAGGTEGVDHLLETRADFSAIIAGNDDIALGAVHRLHELNIAIPQDISIVGFDDAPHAAFTYPPLTTVRQDFYKLGNLATDYLISLIEDDDAITYQRVLKPELIIRKSTRKL